MLHAAGYKFDKSIEKLTPAQIELIARAQAYINTGNNGPTEEITPSGRKLIRMTEEEFERSLRGKATIDQLKARMEEAKKRAIEEAREYARARIEEARKRLRFDKKCPTFEKRL